MADVLFRRGDGVIEMTATNNGPNTLERTPLCSVIVSGPTAGTYRVKLNNTEFELVTGADHLSMQFEIPMILNNVELVSQPANGHVYLILAQSPKG